MTQEDKELLLKDLCARLPYGFVVHRYSDNRDIAFKQKEIDLFAHFLEYSEGEIFKPYLRPMSSMTEEEKGELKLEQEKDEELFIQVINKSQNGDDSLLGTVIPHCAEDWANKNHFDYRGLIEKGLALEAPKGMYSIKEK